MTLGGSQVFVPIIEAVLECRDSRELGGAGEREGKECWGEAKRKQGTVDSLRD